MERTTARRRHVSRAFWALASLAVAGTTAASAADPAPANEAALADSGEQAVVTFSGFHAHDDRTSELHVHLTRSTTVTREQEGQTVIYLLANTRIRFRNNKNPLDARHFDSNLVSAKLDTAGRDTRLTLKLRTATPTEHRLEQRKDSAVLHIDIPAPEAKTDDPG